MISDIRAPSQARSQRTMEEVYRSLDALLKEKSFDRITIADIAARSEAAVGSIYARFKDKNALLAGLHLRVTEQAILCLGPLGKASKWEASSDEEMVQGILKAVNRFYRRQAHILHAALLADLEPIGKMRTDTWEVAIDNFTALLIERSPGTDRASLQLAVRTMVRFTTAIMHQSISIDWIDRWKGGIRNTAVIDELTRFCLDVITRAKDGQLTAG